LKMITLAYRTSCPVHHLKPIPTTFTKTISCTIAPSSRHQERPSIRCTLIPCSPPIVSTVPTASTVTSSQLPVQRVISDLENPQNTTGCWKSREMKRLKSMSQLPLSFGNFFAFLSKIESKLLRLCSMGTKHINFWSSMLSSLIFFKLPLILTTLVH